MPSVNKAVGGNVNVTGLVGQVNVVANFGTITVTSSGLVAQDSVAADFPAPLKYQLRKLYLLLMWLLI